MNVQMTLIYISWKSKTARRSKTRSNKNKALQRIYNRNSETIYGLDPRLFRDKAGPYWLRGVVDWYGDAHAAFFSCLGSEFAKIPRTIITIEKGNNELARKTKCSDKHIERIVRSYKVSKGGRKEGRKI